MGVVALRDNINGMFDDQCVKVYNPKEQKLIAIYKNFSHAGNKLGVSSSTVQGACTRKGRFFSNTFSMIVATRISAMKEEYNEIIEKSMKFKKI